MAHKAVEMKRSERSDAEIQLSKQVVQTFPSSASAEAVGPASGARDELARMTSSLIISANAPKTLRSWS
jgi:hypothetical protein